MSAAAPRRPNRRPVLATTLALAGLAALAFTPALVPDARAGLAGPGSAALDAATRSATRLVGAADTRAPFRYRLAMAEPQRHEFQVELEFDDLPGEIAELKLPKWNPGAYHLSDAHRNVRAVIAERLDAKRNEDPLLPVAKLDENTWEVGHGGAPFKLSYRVYCGSYTGIGGCYLDPEMGFVNGVYTFMYAVGHKQRPIELRVVELPGGRKAEVVTGLPRAKPQAKTTFWASSYDVLVDSPIHAGEVELVEFELHGRPIRAMFSREGAWEADEVKAELESITATAAEIFGPPETAIPFNDYTFIYHVLPNNSGGLEHRNSTVCGVDPWWFDERRGKRRFWSVSAHEFFHLWNVKRIRPAVLGPFDYDSEVHTTMLWFSEGFTSYYTSLIMARSGLLDDDELLEDLERRIGRIETKGGRKLMSVEQSSWETWAKPDDYDKAYFSYYDKGAIIGMLFDLHLRHATKGQASTDSLFRALWDRYRETGLGLTPAALEQAFMDQAKLDVTGAALEHMREMYDAYVHGTAELDYDRYLAHAGYRLDRTIDDRGPWIGAEIRSVGGELVAHSVDHESPADRAGIGDGDVIVSIDDHALPSLSRYREVLAGLEIGVEHSVIIERLGRQHSLTITPIEHGEPRLQIVELDDVSAEQSLLRREWLGLEDN